MIKLLCCIAALMLSSTFVSAQLPRVGTVISPSEKLYFGLGRRIENVDSMRVVKGAGVTLFGIRRDSIVDSVSFTADEVPALERYLRDYEKLLSSEKDIFLNDSSLTRLLTRCSPRQFFDSTAKPVSIRLSTGTVKTGIPLAVTDDNILLSNGLTFAPEVDVLSGSFVCIPASIIETMTPDVDNVSPRLFSVKGDASQFRTALRLSCPVRSYAAGVPPEAQSCVSQVPIELGEGAPLYRVMPRAMKWSITGFGGLASTRLEPLARVQLPFGILSYYDTLTVQEVTNSFGAELMHPVSALFDLGVRGLIQVQPSTVDDDVPQHSLGYDEYSLQFLATLHLLQIDNIGYSPFGLSTSLGVGPSYLNYRGRTHRNGRNLTTTGSGIAVNVSWNVQAMVALTRALSIGARAQVMYQQGLSFSMEDIVWQQEFSRPWVASFSMVQQTSAQFGLFFVATYTLL